MKATVAASAVAAAPLILPSRAWGANAPSNRINVGVIGLGTRGIPDMQQFMKHDDIQIRALCDVNTASKGYRDEEAVMGRQPAVKLASDYYAKKNGTASYDGIV